MHLCNHLLWIASVCVISTAGFSCKQDKTALYGDHLNLVFLFMIGSNYTSGNGLISRPFLLISSAKLSL